MVFDELTGNLRKTKLQYLNFSQVQMGIVKSFLFGSRYCWAYGFAEAFGENACGLGSSVSKFRMRQQQGLIKADFPIKLFVETTLCIGVWHYRVPDRDYTIPAMMSDVLCPIADSLFEKFAEATHEHFEATDNLSMLTGQHKGFAAAKKVADEKRSKARAARQALEQHWKKHRCPGAGKTGHGG
ncbi:MAG: hypothetical protein WAL95_17960 [Candidatus Acidiferrales bacterium]